jgi:ABC-type nitrate/sulfonate/bicarbonate transport system substrate-binding protein
VLLGGSGQWYAHRYQTVYGINPKDINLVNLAAPEWLPAMARGDIQCFFGWEPWLTQLPDTVPGAKVIHRNAEDGVYTLLNPIGFNATWIQEDPEAAKAALRALIETMTWVNDNRTETAQIAAKAFQLEAPVLETQMSCCTYDVALTNDLIAAFNDMAKWGIDQGLINADAGQLVSSLVSPDMLQAVAPERCTADICKK